MNRNISCHCGNNFSISYDEEIDLDQKPELIENILNGTFMSYNCPACRKKHKPEYRIMIKWESKNRQIEVLTELERGEFYRRKKEKTVIETIIGFPEMSDRIAVIKDDLEPAVIETLKSFLLAKAEENYPDSNINAWYYGKGSDGIEFHLDGIRRDEVAVMRVPLEVYENTVTDYQNNPKKDIYSSLRVHSYLSVQNLYRPEIFK